MMAARAAVLLLVLVMADNAVRPTSCFNLETRLPIVKRGSSGSYFGYSVAGHQSVYLDDYDEEKVKTWILVGAPKDQNLQPETNRSGALWKCPFTSKHNDCEQVVTDGKRNVNNGLYNRSIDSTHLSPPQSNELKNDQWLGVMVQSQGRCGKVVVCAHRYISRGLDYQWGFGLCYSFNQDLDLVNWWEPCLGLGRIGDHTEFGVCQAGTSGVILDDDTIVLGSPGSFTWRGNIFSVNVSEEFLERDKTLYRSPIQNNEGPPVDMYSYLGMSVTAAFFFGKQKRVYAAGAPRSNGTGQVVLFTKQGLPSSLMNVDLVISGEQLASNFGYELATADLNGDQEPDLIVGAPFYFTNELGGAVYIYMNNANHCFTCIPPIKLVGKPESRFGFAITNLGDLNQDKYDDIAIGAPYEGRGVIYIYLGSKDGIIIEPSQIIKAEDLAVGNLDVRTLGYSLSGNKLDLDENGYPDLISGAYDSDMAILIRARPIININISVGESEELSNIDPTKRGCMTNNTSSVTCFTFETCCFLDYVNAEDRSQKIKLHYKLDAEVFDGGRKFSRVYFGTDHVSKSHLVEKDFTVALNGGKTCQSHTAYLKENTVDFQSPIAIKISYSLVQNQVPIPKSDDPVPSLDNLPILNRNQAGKIFLATFNKDCGKNDRCESKVHVNAEFVLPKKKVNEYELVMGEHGEILLNMTASNVGESAYESRLFITYPNSFNYIGMVKLDEAKQIDCSPFNETVVVCALGNPFKKSTFTNIQLRFDPKELNDSENRLEFIVFTNSTSYETEPQNPLILSVIVIKLSELSLDGLARPEQVFYGSHIKDINSIKYRDEVGSKILHTYQVFNSGPGKVSNLEVHIDWPQQIVNHHDSEKWLLYLDEKPYVESLSGGECLVPENQINPMHLLVRPGGQEVPFDNVSSENSALNSFMSSKSTLTTKKSNNSVKYQNRVRREQNYVMGAEIYTKDNGKSLEIVKMSCLLGNAKCFKFVCVIYNLRKNQEATIIIKARLWNATLLQNYPKVDSVKIASRAKIYIPSEQSFQQNFLDDEFEVVTTARVDLLDQQEQESIPWWIIILAILVGILLLIFLTWLLWKLGFFKRRRPDPTLSGNIEKHRVDDNYYDY